MISEEGDWTMKKKYAVSLAALALIVAVPLAVQATTELTNPTVKERAAGEVSNMTAPQPISKEQQSQGPRFDWSKTPKVRMLPKGISNMAEPRPIEELENTPITSQATPNSVQESTTQSVINPEFITSPNWKYWDLPHNTYVDTKDWYTLTGKQDVPIKFVQYPAAGYSSSSSVSVGYQLIGDWGYPATSEVIINGTYTSTAGSYKLRIINRSGSKCKVDGNGYVFYW